MDKEMKGKWVAALRSGEYKQGRGALKVAGHGTHHCCLGVLCELQEDAAWKHSRFSENYLMFQGIDEELLPDTLREKLGIGTEDQWTLIELNDKGAKFPEIADYIEAHL